MCDIDDEIVNLNRCQSSWPTSLLGLVLTTSYVTCVRQDERFLKQIHMHLIANTNLDLQWIETMTYKAMSIANAGASVDCKNCWSHTEQYLMPLETTIVQAIQDCLYKKGKLSCTLYSLNGDGRPKDPH